MRYRIFDYDPALLPYERDIKKRYSDYKNKKQELVGKNGKLSEFANGHKYFGFHRTEDGWVYREWAPGANTLYLMGDMNGWDHYSLPMKNIGNGVFEIRISSSLLPYRCRLAAVVNAKPKKG